jgi:hypothetical protein
VDTTLAQQKVSNPLTQQNSGQAYSLVEEEEEQQLLLLLLPLNHSSSSATKGL